MDGIGHRQKNWPQFRLDVYITLLLTLDRLNDPDNRSVTDRLVSQFPHVSGGDIKGIVLCKRAS